MKIGFHSVFGIAALALPFIAAADLAFADITMDQKACIANTATGFVLEDEIAKEDSNPLAIAMVPTIVPTMIMKELTADDFVWEDFRAEMIADEAFLSPERAEILFALCDLD